jgi:hypothetical protein
MMYFWSSTPSSGVKTQSETENAEDIMQTSGEEHDPLRSEVREGHEYQETQDYHDHRDHQDYRDDEPRDNESHDNESRDNESHDNESRDNESRDNESRDCNESCDDEPLDDEHRDQHIRDRHESRDQHEHRNQHIRDRHEPRDHYESRDQHGHRGQHSRERQEAKVRQTEVWVARRIIYLKDTNQDPQQSTSVSDEVTESRSLREKHSIKGEKDRERDASSRDWDGAKSTDITDDTIKAARRTKTREHFENPSEPPARNLEEVRSLITLLPIEERVRTHSFCFEGAKTQSPK